MEKKYYSFKIDAYKGHELKDKSYPILLVVRKDNKRKTINLGISAMYEKKEIKKHDGTKEVIVNSEWNESFERYETKKSKKLLHPDRIELNSWLNKTQERCKTIIEDFEKNKIDWTLNQFKAAFLIKAERNNVKEFFEETIKSFKDSGKIGNAKVYENTLHILMKSDKNFGSYNFNEIDLQYIKDFDSYLDGRKCSTNTKHHYLKTFRALYGKAINDNKASKIIYPFGEGGLKLKTEKTENRFLPNVYIEQIKTTTFENYHLEWCRRLFLTSYYLQGMSFVDMAHLTKENIRVYDDGRYITYKRQKTKANGNPIHIRINEHLQSLLNWFKSDPSLIDDYLIPIISIDGYKDEVLYNHVRYRYRRYSEWLRKMGKELKFEGITLNSYVSRHSFAMRLKNSGVSEDLISETLGHKDLKVTKTYLDSFPKKVVSDAVDKNI